jgi:hypothetical protein
MSFSKKVFLMFCFSNVKIGLYLKQTNTGFETFASTYYYATCWIPNLLNFWNSKMPSLEPEGLYAAIFGFLGVAIALHFALLSLAPEQLYVAIFCLLGIAVALHFTLLRLPYRRLMRVNDRLPETRRWNGMRITFLHLVPLTAYLGVNVAFLMVGVKNNQARARRAAVAASTNLVLVVAGGRTNVLANSVGVPYQIYYFAHHWLARLAIAEATVHGVLNRDGKRTTQWVFGLLVSAAACPGHTESDPL